MKALFLLVLLSGCGSMPVHTIMPLPLPEQRPEAVSAAEPIPPAPAPMAFAAPARMVESAPESEPHPDTWYEKAMSSAPPEQVQSRIGTQTTTVTTPLPGGGTEVVTTVVDIIRVVPIAAGVPQAKSVADWITQILIWLGMASPLGIAWYTLYEKKRKRRLKETNSG